MRKEFVGGKEQTKEKKSAKTLQTKHETVFSQAKVPDYDKGYKRVCSVKEEILHFLKKYVRAEWTADLTEEDIRPCPTELILPDYDTRIPDLVFEIRKGGVWMCCYIIVQLQSSVDYTMVFRFASEMQGILMKSFLDKEKNERSRKNCRIPAAVPVLLYNGRRKWTAVKRYRDYQADGERYGKHILDFEYYLVDISQLDDRKIMSSNYLIDNIIYLDKHRYDLRNLLEKLSVVTKRIADLDPEKKRIFWEWMEHVFAASVNENYRESVRDIISEAKGEESMFKYAITDMIETTLRKEAAKGRKEGRREGRKEGRKEGQREGRKTELIRIIVRKLDESLSAESIAYWLGEDEAFVKEVERLHQANPGADEQSLMQLYNSGNQKII